jgi:hypothetical protein
MARRSRPRPPRRRASTPRLGPHIFEADPDLPADTYTGKSVCKTCQSQGAPGDQRHPDKAELPKAQPAHIVAAQAELDAAILGETGDDA